jgi:hypothetical protein
MVDEAIFLEAMDRIFQHREYQGTLPCGNFAAPCEQLHRKNHVRLTLEPAPDCD